MENKMPPKSKKYINQKATEEFKRKYFDYYDDVKSPTHKVIDW